MKIKAILFDVIGTTVLEKNTHTIKNCLVTAFEEYGITINDDIITSNRGKDKLEMIRLILQKENLDDRLAKLIFRSFKKNIDDSMQNFQANNNADYLFKFLKNKGIKIGIGTGLPREQLDNIMKHLNWTVNDFDFVSTSNEIGKTRPNPAMILKMIKKFKIKNRDEFLKIGDTITDIREGKNASVKTAVLLSGTQDKKHLKSERPDYLLNDLIEVIQIVK